MAINNPPFPYTNPQLYEVGNANGTRTKPVRR